MKRKVPKSLQAIIITLLVGMFLPKLISLTGVTLVDKVIWKIVLTLAFNLATIICWSSIFHQTYSRQSRRRQGKDNHIFCYYRRFLMLCLFNYRILHGSGKMGFDRSWGNSIGTCPCHYLLLCFLCQEK